MDHRLASAPEKCKKPPYTGQTYPALCAFTEAQRVGFVCQQSRKLCLGAYSTCVSQALKVSSFPCTTRKNACCSLCVMGPGRPLPIVRLSTSRIGVISAAVPVKKTSSAIYSSSREKIVSCTVS